MKINIPMRHKPFVKMAIGNAWSVHRIFTQKRGGTLYNYGLNKDMTEAKPRYPVPATQKPQTIK